MILTRSFQSAFFGISSHEGHGNLSGLIDSLRWEWGHRADGESAGGKGGPEERGICLIDRYINNISDGNGLLVYGAEPLQATASEEVIRVAA